MNRPYYCDICDYECSHRYDMNKHFMTKKHEKKRIFLGKNANEDRFFIKPEVVYKEYNCEICSYMTKKLYDYNRHLETYKHKRLSENQTTKSVDINDMLKDNGILSKDDLILKLFQDNKEMQNFFIDQQKEMLRIMTETTHGTVKVMAEQNNKLLDMVKQPSTSNTINGNLNQNHFNINVFLNERCKNAMNFSDFIESIKVSREDLENNAKLGFVGGMTKIIVDNLKKQDLSERSIHCTDFKRETIYIKDNDEWTKQENNEKIHKAISTVSTKSIVTLRDLKEENPEYKDYDSEFYKMSNMMLQNSIAAGEKNKYYPKIVRNIARETTINKDKMVEI